MHNSSERLACMLLLIPEIYSIPFRRNDFLAVSVCILAGADSAGFGGTGEAALSGGRERQPAQTKGHARESRTGDPHCSHQC